MSSLEPSPPDMPRVTSKLQRNSQKSKYAARCAQLSASILERATKPLEDAATVRLPSPGVSKPRRRIATRPFGASSKCSPARGCEPSELLPAISGEVYAMVAMRNSIPA